jgi:phage-related protein
MEKPIFYAGGARTIEAAVLASGGMPAKEFVESLGEGDQAKVYALFRMFGDTGKITNPEKFKRIEGTEFYEFKSFQIRMPCFFMPSGRVVVTHGFKKQKDRIPNAEMNRARRIKAEHISREGGTP